MRARLSFPPRLRALRPWSVADIDTDRKANVQQIKLI